ncbi:N-acetylmuramoyl-L-alanine amidase family protein [Niveispirillum fermenti]|uniref:N-acetylmuramoyl-L-alanine amidase family protein n=1 Tax=Niveispirillum fermenti TaxID=1233113 RepID=UPI003A83B277
MNRRDLIRFALGVPVLAPMASVTLLHAPAMAQAQDGGKPKPPGRKPRPPRLVMIDPGHGGRDPGAIGARGTYEKNVVLDIAKEMARIASRTTGWQVELTRDGDSFIDLKERVRIAQKARADLFISVHADSAPNKGARGLSAYTLSEKASDDFAAAIARQENIAGGGLGVDVSGLDENVAAILVDLAARHTVTAALHAKQSIIQGAGKDVRLLENPMRSANFAVLKAPDIPSLLIETGFLSNPQDEALLRDAAARRRIAGILARELSAVMGAAPFA